jgi:hypothetical protein
MCLPGGSDSVCVSCFGVHCTVAIMVGCHRAEECDFSSSHPLNSRNQHIAISLLSLRTGQLLYYGKYVRIANTEVSIALPITSVAILQVNKQHRRHPAFDHNPTKQKRSRLLQALEAHSHERFRTAAANSRISQNLHLTRSEASNIQ